MKNAKSISLVLVLPLLLAACDEVIESPPSRIAPLPAPTTEEALTPPAGPTEAAEPEVETETKPEPAIEAGLTGVFAYNVEYPTPKGITAMDATFVLKDGAVQRFSLAGNPAHRASLDHQLLFESGVEALVVGKAIVEVGAVPQKINGSSLTATGFNKALEQLKAEG